MRKPSAPLNLFSADRLDCAAHRYTASKALAKFNAKIKTDEDEGQEPILEEAKAAEAAVNATELELATGQEAVFGGVYQFLNESSNKYLQAKKTIAEEDATALRCSMVDASDRSKMPWFCIRPGFRTRNEGEERFRYKKQYPARGC